MTKPGKTQSAGSRVSAPGRGSWCNADSIAMETLGGKAQIRRRGLKKEEEIAALYMGGGDVPVGGGVWMRGEGPVDK